MNNRDSMPCNLKQNLTFWNKLLFFVRDRDKWGGTQSKLHLSYWRRFIFILFASANRKTMSDLLNFVFDNPLVFSIVSNHPSILEQVTRQWLFHNSTLKERAELSKEHFSFVQSRFLETALAKIYLQDGIRIWQQEFQASKLSLKLHYERFYRKEGLMGVSLLLGTTRLYSSVFWFGRDKDGEQAMWIGCLQGSRGQSEIIHDVTKHFLGYRPKNLMIYVLRCIANLLEISRIYTVSNHGSYVNHRMRSKRRLKTSLDEFWGEVGGRVSIDSRFYEVPLIEYRKPIEEVPSHKRSQYRKRFAILDSLTSEIESMLGPSFQEPRRKQYIG